MWMMGGVNDNSQNEVQKATSVLNKCQQRSKFLDQL